MSQIIGPGHYEVWQRWQRAHAPIASLASVIRGHVYEEWPRGQLVFDCKGDRFFLYADRRIHKAGILPELVASFCLPRDRVIVRADPTLPQPAFHFGAGGSPGPSLTGRTVAISWRAGGRTHLGPRLDVRQL